MEHERKNVVRKKRNCHCMQAGLCTIILAMAVIGKALLKLLYGTKNRMERYEIELKNLKKRHAVLEHWLSIKIRGEKLESYFKENGFETVAVYGLGTLGCCLCRELQGSSVAEVKYGIDSNLGVSKYMVRLRKLSAEIVPVDVVVVTAITSFHEIKKELEKYYQCPILSLEEIIYSL